MGLRRGAGTLPEETLDTPPERTRSGPISGASQALTCGFADPPGDTPDDHFGPLANVPASTYGYHYI